MLSDDTIKNLIETVDNLLKINILQDKKTNWLSHRIDMVEHRIGKLEKLLEKRKGVGRWKRIRKR